MKETILITGSSGYVGGRLAKYLAQNTKHYLLLGVRGNISNPPSWLTNGEIIKLDVLNDNQLITACERATVIIHLAAINEIDCLRNPESAVNINTLGTLKLLRSAEKNGVNKIIYFSTAHVYGELIGKITENTLPRPTHPYAITHKAAEDFILASHHEKKIIGIVLRLSNSFGVPERHQVNRWTLVVNDLCKQVVTTGEMVLNSSGLQRRDFITLDDVCRAVDHTITLSDVEYGDGVFNLGGENALRIIDIVDLISIRCENIFGFKPNIQCENTSDETSPSLEYSIDKFKATGFSLDRNFEKEIDATLNLCKKVF